MRWLKSYERKENFCLSSARIGYRKGIFPANFRKVEPQFQSVHIGGKDAQDDGIYDRKFDTFLPGLP